MKVENVWEIRHIPEGSPSRAKEGNLAVEAGTYRVNYRNHRGDHNNFDIYRYC